ncbi:MAG: hypothetical protein N4A70_19960 [Pelagimonas sp.]|jgi:hypothetical protein|nr:hypothetical protein [Pelagimonas sp.]
MHAMILDKSPKRLEQEQIAFIESGIDVTGSGSLAVAEACLKRSVIDILVIDRRSAGQRFAEFVRLAEYRNPNLVTITLTPDVSGDTDRLVQAFPSVHVVLGSEVSPTVAARMAMASIAGQAQCNVAAPQPTPTAPAQPYAAQPQAGGHPLYADQDRGALELAQEISEALDTRQDSYQQRPAPQPVFSSRRSDMVAA